MKTMKRRKYQEEGPRKYKESSTFYAITVHLEFFLYSNCSQLSLLSSQSFVSENKTVYYKNDFNKFKDTFYPVLIELSSLLALQLWFLLQ